MYLDVFIKRLPQDEGGQFLTWKGRIPARTFPFIRNSMSYQPFYELDAWKRARKFKLAVYEILDRFPDHERHELYSQLRRSARSVPTNISEGHGRFTFKDQKNFCVIARGSLSETFNHLIDAFDCGYITREELSELKTQWTETGKVLNGYLSFLQSKADGGENKSSIVREDDIEYIADEPRTNDNTDFVAQLNF